MTVKSMLASVAVAAAISTLPLGVAEARYGRAYEDGLLITAYSRHGNGSVTGPIRRGPHAWEVRLPHGTWVSCRRSCEETLRVETVDIFENDGRMVGYGTFQNQCGVFGCLELRLPR